MESAGIFDVNLRVTRNEIEALSAGLSMASHYLPHLKDAADSLWDKLAGYIPEQIISWGAEIVRSMMAASPVAKVDPEVFNTLLEAKHSHRAVNILYSAPGRMPRNWTLSPYDFYFRGHAWYMVSCNHEYKNLGLHRISRIISASIMPDEKYIVPEESGFTEDYILSAWHVIPGFERNFMRVHITEPLAESFREIQ